MLFARATSDTVGFSLREVGALGVRPISVLRFWTSEGLTQA